jgi:DNA (cytosine-5)-methyltransferase 1
MFEPIWYLKDIKQDKPVKVFTIFSCGGGSSMGYKRAGFEVIGNCEIDPRMNSVYVANNHPKYNYNMDVREFLQKDDLPEELYNLDILDASPPCSAFSSCGEREDAWGKEKVFREGQKAQTLDDLFFVYLNVVEKLKPRCTIAENVVGLVNGNAKGYVNQIIKRYRELGYEVQLFQLNSALMEVPQSRPRVFFVANRMGYPKLNLKFNYKPIKFGDIRSKEPGNEPGKDSVTYKLLQIAKSSDKKLADVNKRIGKKASMFNQTIVWDGDIAPTQTAGTIPFRGCDKTFFTIHDIKTVQSFPQDYNFVNNTVNNAAYICGMSVPPNMMAHIATEVWKQWLSKDKEIIERMGV